MANNYFQFKQFKVEQNNCAMKIGTDGVLLGAWASLNHPKHILDIGAGTGLISLIMAQKYPLAKIDALEIDTEAFKQATTNFNNSTWNNRLNCIHTSLQSFETTVKYELIVSNPPYFIKSLKNEDASKSIARHTDTLTYSELIEKATELLTPQGSFCMILPYTSKTDFIALCLKNNLFLQAELNVKPTPTKEYKRVLMNFSKIETTKIESSELIIEAFGRHQYSDDYIELTKGFYLNF